MASSVVALSSAPDPARPGTDAEASFLPAKLSKNSSSYGLHCADTSSAEAGVSGELLYSHGSSGPLPSLPSSHTQTSPCCFSEVRIHQPQYMSCFFTLVRSFSSWMLERCSVSPVISCLCDHLQNVAFFPFFL